MLFLFSFTLVDSVLVEAFENHRPLNYFLAVKLRNSMIESVSVRTKREKK